MKSFYIKKTLRNFNRSFFNPPPAYRIRIAFPNHSSFQISLRRGCAVHSIFQRGESSFVFRAKTIYPPDYRASTQLRARTGRIYNREDSYLRCKLDIPRYVLFVLDSNLSNARSITRRITRHSRNPLFPCFTIPLYTGEFAATFRNTLERYIFRPAAQISLRFRTRPIDTRRDRYARWR